MYRTVRKVLPRFRRAKIYKAYPGGYQHLNLRRTLAKYRGLGIFNRKTGEKEIRDRRRAYGISNKMAFDPIYGYPTNNRRTLSLSLRPFTKQVQDLRKSTYFIDQFRGAIKNMYGSAVPKAKLNWSSDIDTLALQARNILRKEEEDIARPVTDYYDRIGQPSSQVNPSFSTQTLRNGAIKKEPAV